MTSGSDGGGGSPSGMPQGHSAGSACKGQPCADMVQRLSDFHDGRYERGSQEAVAVEEHVATCPRCADVLSDYRLISDVAKCLREQKCVPRRGEDEFACCVREAIARRRRHRFAFWTGWGVAAAAAAAIVVAFVLAPGIERSEGTGVPHSYSRGAARVPAHEAEVREKTAVLAPDVPAAVATDLPAGDREKIPAAADPEAVRREIEAVEKLDAGRMPGVVPVGEGGVSVDLSDRQAGRRALPTGVARPRTAGALSGRQALLGVYAAKMEGEPPREGVVVVGVVPGMPAALGGIVPGDVILEVNGRQIGTGGPRRLQEIVGRAGPGASVKVIFRRAETIRRIEIVLAELDVGR